MDNNSRQRRSNPRSKQSPMPGVVKAAVGQEVPPAQSTAVNVPRVSVGARTAAAGGGAGEAILQSPRFVAKARQPRAHQRHKPPCKRYRIKAVLDEAAGEAGNKASPDLCVVAFAWRTSLPCIPGIFCQRFPIST